MAGNLGLVLSAALVVHVHRRVERRTAGARTPPEWSPAYLEQLLTRTGWTRLELARRLGVQPDTVRQWARGDRVPSAKRQRALHALLALLADAPERGAVGRTQAVRRVGARDAPEETERRP